MLGCCLVIIHNKQKYMTYDDVVRRLRELGATNGNVYIIAAERPLAGNIKKFEPDYVFYHTNTPLDLKKLDITPVLGTQQTFVI